MKTNKIKNYFDEFYEGIIQFSLLSVLLALFIAITPFLFGVIWVDEDFMASDSHRLFSNGTREDYPITTSIALQLSNSPKNIKKVVYLGASASRAAFNPESVSSFLSKNLTDNVDVFNLSSSRQTLWESRLLVDKIPKGSEGIVVIGLGPNRLAQTSQELQFLQRGIRLALTADVFDKELSLVGITPTQKTGNYFIDNRHFFVPRYADLVNNIVNGAPIYQNRWYGKPPVDLKYWEKISTEVSSSILKNFDHQVDNNLEVAQRIINDIRQHTTMKIVLTIPPKNPKFIENYLTKDFTLKFQEKVNHFAQSNQLEVLDIANNELTFVEDDFLDWAHFRKIEKAREYSIVLAKNILKHLN